jgi:hypothetical protein
MKRILLICILLSIGLLHADQPNWQPIGGTQYSMVVIADIMLQNQQFTGDGENLAAAFGPGGEDDCRSLGIWYDEGYWYFTVVGNTNGETISFKIYNEADETIYECNQTVTFQDNAIIGSPTDPLMLSVESSMISGNVTLITTSPPAGAITDVTITVDDISVHPNEFGEYQLPLDPGIYDVTASLEGYTTETITEVEVVENQTTEGIDFSLIDWVPISGTEFSMVVIAEAMINDEIVTADDNMYLAAFGEDGEEDCRSVAVWQEPNPPYWDGHWFFTIVSNNNSGNEVISFKGFAADEQILYEFEETIYFENNAVVGSHEEPFLLTTSLLEEQHFSLGENWNWISFRLEAEDPAISQILAPLGNNIYQIKNQTASAIMYQGSWYGDLTHISIGEGYLISMHNPVSEFTLEGIAIPTNTGIPLASGWNWISYLPAEQRSVSDALSSVAGNAQQLKTQQQTALYYDPPGTWIGDLHYMEPGVGYKIQTLADDVLYYDDPERHVVSSTDEQRDNPPGWSPISGTQYNMVLMASVYDDNDELFDDTGDNTLAVFGPGGVDDCRGIAVWQESFGGFWYITVVGNENGEELSFKVYEDASGQIYDCNESLIFQDNSVVGDPENTFMITYQETSAEDGFVSDKTVLHPNYPNPFNPETTIAFSLTQAGHVTIDIFNIQGQKVKTIVDSDFEAGIHKVVWNGRDNKDREVSSGNYLIKMQHNDEITVSKILLLK